jgi:hypothetical protein
MANRGLSQTALPVNYGRILKLGEDVDGRLDVRLAVRDGGLQEHACGYSETVKAG